MVTQLDKGFVKAYLLRNARLLGMLLLLVGGGLASCEPAGQAAQQPIPPVVAFHEPDVLTTTHYYARLLTQPRPPRPDSLRRYLGRSFEPNLFPDHFQLRLRQYTIIVNADSSDLQIHLVPADNTSVNYLEPQSPTQSGTKAIKARQLLFMRPRTSNPPLGVTFQQLLNAFGPWEGEFFGRTEEPMQPDMHSTNIHYRNPATGKTCVLGIELKESPTAAANVVHEIYLRTP